MLYQRLIWTLPGALPNILTFGERALVMARASAGLLERQAGNLRIAVDLHSLYHLWVDRRSAKAWTRNGVLHRLRLSSVGRVIVQGHCVGRPCLY